MKKLIVLLMVVSLLVGPMASPKKADAAIGLFTQQYYIAAAGAVVAGVAYVALETGWNPFGGNCQEFATCFVEAFGVVMLWVLILGGGIVALDAETGAVSFAKMDEATANKIGATKAEMDRWNDDSERDRLNAVMQSITDEMITRTNAGEKITMEMLHSRWQEERGSVSEETFSALWKLSASLAQAS